MEINIEIQRKACKELLEGRVKEVYFLGGKKIICPLEECSFGNQIPFNFEGDDYKICKAYLNMGGDDLKI